MYLYTDCYTKAGYVPMRMELEDGRPEAFGRDRMEQTLPEDIVTLLTCSGLRVFAGELQGRWLLRICGIPTRLRDENRRRCYIHLAFESAQREPVAALTAFVLNEYARFVNLANRMIVYGPNGYDVDRAVLGELLTAARAAGHAQDERAVLVPGAGGLEAFLEHFPAFRAQPPELRQLAPIDETKLPAPIRKDDAKMDLYFYFSSPAAGFTLTCVSPQTGETTAAGAQAADRINSRIYDMVTTGGMSMALFRKNGKLNLVVKKLSTVGKNQRMALVVESGDEELTRALAACAMYRNQELADAVVACVRIDSMDGTGSVDAQAVCALLEWAQSAQAPQGREQGFDKIRQADSYPVVPYLVLVVDPTLDYFNQMMNMHVDRSMVGLLMDDAKYRSLRNPPEAQPEPAKKPDAPVKPEPAKKPDAPKPPQTHGGDTAVTAQDDCESINLLDYKWFLPAACGAAAVLILLIALLIGSLISGRAKAPQEPEDAPVQTQASVQAQTPPDDAQQTAEDAQAEEQEIHSGEGL